MVGNEVLEFYRGKRVLVTGHTGFKGSWLCAMLQAAGADVVGYSLEPPTAPSLFEIAGIGEGMRSIIGDIRDYPALSRAFCETSPQVVFHLAAQPIVRKSYRNPRETYEVNVMGAVNVLECVRNTDCVESFLNVTTDKVYLNREWCWGYREDDPLDGYDPYSNSKSCSELATHSYAKSFLEIAGVPVSTARAGNVIGGGDFSSDRIIPDCLRATESEEPILVRNPFSTRPYQHVLEPLMAYLMIAAAQHSDSSLAGSYNVGPDDADCVNTARLVELFCNEWGEGAAWEARPDGGPHEASFLKLDNSKVKAFIGWRPRWGIREAVARTVEWSKCWKDGRDVRACMKSQISDYMEGDR